jgi:phage terminase small subunit
MTMKKITKKQRAFIDLYVFEDLNQSECAHRAGYKNAAIIAHRLLNDPQYEHVQTKVNELQARQRQKYEITFEKVAEDLKAIRDAAMADGVFGAAVAAELGRAKLAGLMVDRKEVKYGKIDQMDREQVEARLANLMKENKLANVVKNITPEPVVLADLSEKEIQSEIEEDLEEDLEDGLGEEISEV